MKPQIFIALFLILGVIPVDAIDSESIVIESAIYDLHVYESRFEGFCLLVVRAENDSNELHFSSPLEVDMHTENLGFRQDDASFHVKGLNLRGGDVTQILLKLEGRVSDNDLRLPLLRLPYRAEKIIIGVHESTNKFVWKVNFPAYSPEENNDILIAGGISGEAINELDFNLVELRRSLSREEKLPRYRIYLGEIEPGEEVIINAWVGRNYEYYLPNVLEVMVICIILFLIFYFLLTRSHFISEKEPVQLKEKVAEKDKEWLDRMKQKWSAVLKTLENDERTVYKEIFDCDGEILQRILPGKAGFSKAKVTRILDRLEQKRLIERRSFGVTNKVILK